MRLSFGSFIQPLLYANGLESINDNKILNTLYNPFVHLSALENGIKLENGTLNKDMGDFFS